MNSFRTILACVCAMLALSVCAGEDNNNNNPPNNGQNNGGGGRGRGFTRGGGGTDNGGTGGAAGGRTFGGGVDLGSILGGRGGTAGGGIGGAGTRGIEGGVVGIAARSLGVDIQDPKATTKIEDLPLGARKHFITSIPVGGVDNLANTGSGWKVENIYTLTPEATKSMETLRDEYDIEQKKLQKEIAAQSRALAEKVIALRTQYEKKANDLMTGADKESKEKLDALAEDVRKKNTELLVETLPLYDTNDNAATLTLMRSLSEKTSANSKEGELKLIDLVPEKSKEKVTTMIKAQDDARERSLRMLNTTRGQRGPGGATPGGAGAAPGATGTTPGTGIRQAPGTRGGGGLNEPVRPPKPPDGTEQKF